MYWVYMARFWEWGAAEVSPRCSPWVEEPPGEQVEVAWRRLRPMESPAGAGPGPELQPVERSPRRSRALGGAAARGGPVLEQFAPGGWTPW